MFGGFLVLFLITLVGVFISCRVFDYEIELWRKPAAAGAFAALNVLPIPIPILDLLIPAIALYVILMDNTYQRSQVNRVFGLTFVFAVISVVAIYVLPN